MANICSQRKVQPGSYEKPARIIIDYYSGNVSVEQCSNFDDFLNPKSIRDSSSDSIAEILLSLNSHLLTELMNMSNEDLNKMKLDLHLSRSSAILRSLGVDPDSEDEII